VWEETTEISEIYRLIPFTFTGYSSTTGADSVYVLRAGQMFIFRLKRSNWTLRLERIFRGSFLELLFLFNTMSSFFTSFISMECPDL
jgi:hypothetical protein